MEKEDKKLSAKEESFKDLLKAADEKQLIDLVTTVTEEIRNGRYRKAEVQRAVVTVLSQKRPRVNSVTRQTYQAFANNVRGAAFKNQEVMRKLRNFAKNNDLSWSN